MRSGFQGEAGLLLGRCGSGSGVSAAFSIEHLLCSKVSTSWNGGKREAPLSRVLVLSASLPIRYLGTLRRGCHIGIPQTGGFLLSGNEDRRIAGRLGKNMRGQVPVTRDKLTAREGGLDEGAFGNTRKHPPRFS